MKTIFALLVALAAGMASAADLVMMNDEPDYAATALKTQGGTPAPGGNSGSGCFSGGGAEGIFGFSIRSYDAAKFADVPNALVQKIEVLLKSNRWQVDAPMEALHGDENAANFLFTATRGKERLEIIVFWFPQEGGLGRVAYVQRRQAGSPE
jgi:hypothetical protein